MVSGYLIMFAYTILMLGRINLVEHRTYLTAAGIVSVAMGLSISIGISSILNLPYTPMHAILPFLCLGKCLFFFIFCQFFEFCNIIFIWMFNLSISEIFLLPEGVTIIFLNVSNRNWQENYLKNWQKKICTSSHMMEFLLKNYICTM